jgi:hypothetical protein
VACRALELPDGRLCSDQDLDPLRPPPGSAWPRRFVGLDPAHPRVQALAELYRASPGIALAAAVDALAVESRLLRPRAAALRRAAGRVALRGPA